MAGGTLAAALEVASGFFLPNSDDFMSDNAASDSLGLEAGACVRDHRYCKQRISSSIKSQAALLPFI
jgi:hypothetical protein